jgi:hypothetical protein
LVMDFELPLRPQLPHNPSSNDPRFLRDLGLLDLLDRLVNKQTDLQFEYLDRKSRTETSLFRYSNCRSVCLLTSLLLENDPRLTFVLDHTSARNSVLELYLVFCNTALATAGSGVLQGAISGSHNNHKISDLVGLDWTGFRVRIQSSPVQGLWDSWSASANPVLTIA